MRVRFVLCLTIVAAFQGRLGAQSAISEDVPIPGGTSAVAEALGIEPVPDRARFIGELTRIVYQVPQGTNPATDDRLRRLKVLLGSMRAPAGQAIAPAELVPIPLTAAVWGQAVFHRPLTADNLFAAILGDRHAALLCHGLAGLDDETLRFLVERPALIEMLYQRAAPAFGGFGVYLHVRDGKVAPPGGTDAVPLWEAAVGEPVDRPDRFVRELFERSDGRIAYLYSAIAQVDRASAAFALGLWIDARQTRIERFKALAAATAAAYREWRVQSLPFARPPYDLATLLARVHTDEIGRPVLASGELWARAFAVGPPPVFPEQSSVIDAAWLAQVVAGGESRMRVDRLDEFAFGQRVFATASDDTLPDVLETLRAFPRCRMLMLTLERLGIRSPAIYAATARRAEGLATLNASRAFAALAQFQGTLALLTRMVRVRTIDAAGAETLVSSLIAVPLTGDGRYAGALARWLQEKLRPVLPPANDVDAALLDGLAGKRGAVSSPVPLVAWEGQRYRFDLATAELRRLHRVREKQGGAMVDWAILLDGAARTLMSGAVTVADVRSASDTIERIADKLPSKTAESAAMNALDAGTRPHDVLDEVVRRLSKIDKEKDTGTAARIVAPCENIADRILSEALLSLAYAVDIGDPDGAALLAGNVAERHDFGVSLRDGEARARAAWDLPKSNIAPGIEWHISGSLLGLDIAMAPLTLRRINADRVIPAPTLTSNERGTFAVSLALMDPFALDDADRDVIGESLRLGRARVAAMNTDTFDVIADEIGMDGWRRRAARWTLVHQDRSGTDIRSLFSMTEFLRLGGAPVMALDAWGMAALTSAGCLCTRLMPGAQWTLWTGRPQLGLLATTLADLNLLIAETLHDMRLPAALARHVLAAAVQDFIDDVRPTDPDDWLTLVRAAQRVTRERVEDYVAATAANGPLLPDAGPDVLRPVR